MKLVSRDGISWFESALLNGTGVVHGFGTKDVGVEIFARSCGIAASDVQATNQVHGSDVHFIHNVSSDVVKGDGFVTTEYGIILHIRTADCLPILWSDPLKGAIGAVHAGWRGLASGVIGRSLELASSRAGVSPSDVRCAIGPAIGPDCYEVGPDVIAAMADAGHDIARVASAKRDKKWLLNICACAVAELVRLGVPSSQIDSHGLARGNLSSEHGEREGEAPQALPVGGNATTELGDPAKLGERGSTHRREPEGTQAPVIDIADVCTHCDSDMLHSYRRSPNIRGRQVSFIMLGPACR